MRKVIATAMVSLDGVMQAPGGPQEDPTGGFKYGGWVEPYFDEVGGQVVREEFSKPFDLLLGRKTYDIFAAHWPYVEIDPAKSAFDKLNSDIAKTFNAITKYVATHASAPLTWNNSVAIHDAGSTWQSSRRRTGPIC